MNASETLEALRKIDARYPSLNATEAVLRVVTGDVPLDELEGFLRSSEGLEPSAAAAVREELNRIVLGRLAAALPGVQPKPAIIPTAPTPGVAEFHDAADAVEIARHQERLAELDRRPVPEATTVADAIAAELKIPLPDPNLQHRYRTIAESALKGIRKPFEVRDLLTRPVKIGGLDLPSELADRLLSTFASRSAPFHAPAGTSFSSNAPTGPRNIPARKPGPDRLARMPAAPVVPKAVPKTSATPMPPPNLPVAPTVVVPRVQAVPPRAPTPPAAARQSVPSGRPTVVDVRKPKRTVGPVDELGLLTVDDLRRLDRDPETALTKLWGKFQNLSKESFTMFADGIKAWRRSPLYQLYVGIGAESMASGRAVDEVANARLAANQATLSPKEFALIADLNRQLRLS